MPWDFWESDPSRHCIECDKRFNGRERCWTEALGDPDREYCTKCKEKKEHEVKDEDN